MGSQVLDLALFDLEAHAPLRRLSAIAAHPHCPSILLYHLSLSRASAAFSPDQRKTCDVGGVHVKIAAHGESAKDMSHCMLQRWDG